MKDPFKEQIGGDILIIGGAEDKMNERHILRKFYELAGGKDASILIIPISSDFPEIAGNVYKDIFQRMGVENVNILKASSRHEIMQINAKEILTGVSGVFITGGDQMRLSSLMGGTEFTMLLKKHVSKGVVIAGSSAGAAGMSSSMIVRGEPTIQPQKDSIRLAPGLAVLKDIVIDQHFTQRARLSRLITAVCYNPKNLGIGIDENTAIHITSKGILEVLGAGTVTIVDGSNLSFNNIAEVGDKEPFSVFGLQIHILSSSIRYDISNRKPIEIVGDYLQI